MDEEVVEEQEEQAPEEAPEPAPADAPAGSDVSYLVLERVRYEVDGDEFYAGPGEVIDAAAAAQCDPASVEAL